MDEETAPTAAYDDGSAWWDVDSFEVAAYPAALNRSAVTLDGRATSPATARRLAAVLLAAARRADGQT